MFHNLRVDVLELGQEQPEFWRFQSLSSFVEALCQSVTILNALTTARFFRRNYVLHNVPSYPSLGRWGGARPCHFQRTFRRRFARRGLRITPEELKWKPGPVPGHEIAPLIGDSIKPGPFVERVKFPPDSISQAHSHPEARAYTIISGTWYVGYGDKFDPAKLKALPADSFYTEPANVNHFSQIQEDGVVVQIVGNGPTATRFFVPPDAPKN
jgi:quercetin dioxygenase-like cupin family protein